MFENKKGAFFFFKEQGTMSARGGMPGMHIEEDLSAKPRERNTCLFQLEGSYNSWLDLARGVFNLHENFGPRSNTALGVIVTKDFDLGQGVEDMSDSTLVEEL